ARAESCQHNAVALGLNARLKMQVVATRMNSHNIDACSTDRSWQADCIRGFKIAHRPESIGMVAAELECAPCRHDPTAKGDKYAFFRIGRVCRQMDCSRQIGWTIRIGVISGELRAGEDHRLG